MTVSDIDQAFANGELKGLHSILAIHKGQPILERHYPGNDQFWGLSLGHIQSSPTRIHDLRSVTKSIVSLLYGIALFEGKVPAVDAVLVDQFPEYKDLQEDPLRRRITVEDALTMQMGLEWNEALPYSDPNNSERAMETAPDRNYYILSQKIIQEPGTQWLYGGGATAIIGALIQKGTGQKLDDYAKEKLFSPLGIQQVEWIHGIDGVPAAASGLRLNIHDLAKIGELLLNQGCLQGQQIIPAEWLKAAMTPHTTTSDGIRYGYSWWLAQEDSPTPWFAAFGNGGQRLMINPQHQLVVSMFAGEYDNHDVWKLFVKVLEDFVFPRI